MIAAVGLPLSSVIIALLLSAIGDLSFCAKLLIGDCLYYVPFVILPILIIAKRHPNTCICRRNESPSIRQILLLFPLAFVMLVFNNSVTILWAIPFQNAGMNIYANSIPSAQNARELVIYVISSAAIPAICEEYLFRSVLLNAFEAHGTRRAVLLTSLMFATLHGNLIGLPGEFLAGIIIACVTIAFDSVYAGMILHTAFNTIVTVVSYFQTDSGSGNLTEQLGGMSGVFTIVLDILMFGVCLFFILRTILRRAQTNGSVTVPDSKPSKLSVSERIFSVVAVLAVIFLYIFDILAMR